MLEHMSTDKTSIVVAGAGIGGLASALTLHAAGFEVVVLESAREVKPLGVGINMLPHAVGVLTELGLGERLTRMGIATTQCGGRLREARCVGHRQQIAQLMNLHK
ncbi:flavin-containing monooxygenase [Mycobacteroides abscessus subsp. abscessus]|nr:flavin-containing monooxygenase [Mycobacteroides abscessus subsp. abscessus]